MRAALTVGVGLAILQQVTGINTVIYYAPTIVEYTGINSSASAILASIAVGIVNVGMTVVAIRLLDRAGRRPLLLYGVAGMSCPVHARARLPARRSDDDHVGRRDRQPDAVRRLVRDQPRPDLLAAQLRDLSASHAQQGRRSGTFANWIFNFIVSLTFLLLIDALGQSGAFWLYAGVGVFTFFFCLKLVPETKGKRLEEIEAEFDRRAGVDGPGPDPGPDEPGAGPDPDPVAPAPATP